MTLLRFGFTAVGETRQEVLDELDQIVASVISEAQGEPWVSVIDKVEKIILNKQAISTGTSGFVYQGEREVIFTGPTIIGTNDVHFQDGFRPQGGNDL